MNSNNKKITSRLLSITALFLSLTSALHNPVWAQDGAISDIPFDNVSQNPAVDDDFDVDSDWDDYEVFAVHDPYQKYNRKMFNFNHKVYHNIFAPLSKGYDFLVPNKIQGSFNNFIRFAATPKRFCNNLLQKKFKSSWIEFERLIINGTVGMGGFFDPATRVFNLKQQNEDFGQTLAVYGAGPGPYIIWPIVGPSTLRDAVGLAGDTAFSTFFWLSQYDVESEEAFRAIGVVKRINNYTYNVRSNYNRITDSAIDPYIALQHAYIKNRERNIKE